MNIEQKLLTKNKYSRSGEKQVKLEYIVVHWVGNANTSAINNRNYFENLRITHKTQASAHYIVGLNGEIIQCIPDDEVAFHAGNYSMNRKSVGIENCHPDWSGKFTDMTYNSLLDLCVHLCKKHNIKPENIIRHFDVTGKLCPKYFVEHDAEWNGFKNNVAARLNEKIEPKEEEFEMAKTYRNGSTSENIFCDTNLTKKIGTLSPYEVCECLGIYEGRAVVKYNVSGTKNYKVGFAKYIPKGLQ